MLVIGLTLYFRIFESRLMFYPEKVLAEKPGIPHEDVRFNAADGTRLHGWFLPFAGSHRVFLISHGNAGNIGDRAIMGEFVHQEFKENVFMYDYRGYGNSEGKPSEEGLYSDIRGAVAYLRSRGFDSSRLFLIGQSLGTAVTVDLASHEPVAGVILEAPFPSVSIFARRLAFSFPIDYFLRSHFDSLSKISSIHAPIVVVHGRGDPVVPFDLGQQLFNGIPGRKKFFPANGEIHEGALMALTPTQILELRDFLNIREVQ